MPFQIHALPAEPFAPLFHLSDADLRRHKAHRVTVKEKPGAPCRVSLQDADPGETVILTHYQHLAEGSPFDASHAIYIRENVSQARPAVDEVPALLDLRQLSLRAFDADGIMIDASLVPGRDCAKALTGMFQNEAIDQIHIHYAAPGCFAARATRA